MEAIVLSITILGILVYLYFHEKAERDYIKKIQTDLTSLPLELQKFYMEISKENNTQTQKVLGESFKNFLKHIEKLEKMTLPKPVTTKDVQSVMSRIGEVTEEGKFDNEIESEVDKGAEIPDANWASYINGDTKVAFEDETPTVVEE